MQRDIIEHQDRWIILPLRQQRVLDVVWQPEDIVLLIETDTRLVIGYDAELSLRSIAKGSPDRHVITYWSRIEAEKLLRSEILSPVFFKSGGVRIGFRNGWLLHLP